MIDYRILWSHLDDNDLFTAVSINENYGYFVLERSVSGPCGYNCRQRWIASLDEMLPAFGLQTYTELADYLEGKYKHSGSALADIKADAEDKGVKFEYTS